MRDGAEQFNQLAKVALGQWPTPFAELPRLGEHLGIRLFIKRDDLTGLALGGNKTRKLEYILGDAIEQGCDTVITAGASQSNHCRQTAAAAATLGLQCHLVLGGEEPVVRQGNLLLDTLFGSQIHWSGTKRKGEDIPAIFKQLEVQGRKPYIVPYGGSNALGALGYVSAMQELSAQNSQHQLNAEHQRFEHIVFASSSGGTHAGLALGNKLYSQCRKLTGINIDKVEAGNEFAKNIVALAQATAGLLGIDQMISDTDVTLNSDYLGGGYGVVGKAEREAISLIAQLEGILVDPVYSGRALAGLIGMTRRGEIEQGARVLFWHTGGAPALFAYAQDLLG